MYVLCHNTYSRGCSIEFIFKWCHYISFHLQYCYGNCNTLLLGLLPANWLPIFGLGGITRLRWPNSRKSNSEFSQIRGSLMYCSFPHNNFTKFVKIWISGLRIRGSNKLVVSQKLDKFCHDFMLIISRSLEIRIWNMLHIF